MGAGGDPGGSIGIRRCDVEWRELLVRRQLRPELPHRAFRELVVHRLLAVSGSNSASDNVGGAMISRHFSAEARSCSYSRTRTADSS